jgi:hypothetical protein
MAQRLEVSVAQLAPSALPPLAISRPEVKRAPRTRPHGRAFMIAKTLAPGNRVKVFVIMKSHFRDPEAGPR